MTRLHPLVPPDFGTPRGVRRLAGRWQDDLDALRHELERVLEADPHATYPIAHSGPVARSGLRWFAPGIPMRLIAAPGDPPGSAVYEIPAAATLAALDAGSVVHTPRRTP